MSIVVFPASERFEAKTGAHGRALETLGHAVAYLVDARLFDLSDHNVRDEQEAVQIMMRMSRAVFTEYPEVVSMRKRMGRWAREQLSSSGDFAEQG